MKTFNENNFMERMRKIDFLEMKYGFQMSYSNLFVHITDVN